MVNKPKVSIVMSVWNNGAYIKQTVESLLSQTFTDFELIILDDKGGDNTADIIQEFTDERIKLVDNVENMGLANSMNRGLDLAQGQYIAVMDGDDIALPDRIKIQVEFMDANPDYCMCGTTGFNIDTENKLIRMIHQPSNDMDIRFRMLFAPPFFHPSCMYRVSVLEKHNVRYNDEKYFSGLDSGFWYDLVKHGKAMNIEEPHFAYRKHAGSLSHKSRDRQNSDKADVAMLIINDMAKLSQEEQVEFRKVLMDIISRDEISFEEFKAVVKFIKKYQAFFKSFYKLNNLSEDMKVMSARVMRNAVKASTSPVKKWKMRLYILIHALPEYLSFLRSRSRVKKWEAQHRPSFDEVMKPYVS